MGKVIKKEEILRCDTCGYLYLKQVVLQAKCVILGYEGDNKITTCANCSPKTNKVSVLSVTKCDLTEVG